MSMFDRFHTKDTAHAYTVEEAACGILLAVIACDGNIAMDEMAYFDLITNHHVIFRSCNVAQINRMIDKALVTLHHDGWKRLAQECANTIPEGTRLTLFSLAVDFVFADGIVTEEEEDIIFQIQRIFEISDSQSAPIIEVLAIKNGL